MTPAEREHILQELDQSRAALLRTVEGLTPAQLEYCEAPGRWTVAENLDLPLSYRDIKKTEREGMVADILDRFQIVGKKSLFPNQLSGGQQQIVAVARAVIGRPKLILADEPTGSLHSSQGKMIMDLLRKLNDEGTTIIQVTHNNEWAAYGNRIIQLADGWIVDGQTPASVAAGSPASS